jgi:GTPase SAR1 family protein
MSEASPTCVIIGPTSSGKTSLLGALQFATAKVADQEDLALRILPASSDMVDLIEFSNSPENVGQLQGTLGIKRYVFDYEVRYKNRSRMFQEVFRTRFSMIDSPGGALLGDRKGWIENDQMNVARAELVSELKTAKYIMLCVDSTDSSSTAQFTQFLPGVLSERDRIVSLAKSSLFA